MVDDMTDTVEEVIVEQQRDPVVSVLQFSILFVIVLALTGVIYLLLTNVFEPPAPRTALEAQLVIVSEAVQENPGSGKVWSDYLRALVSVQRYDEAHSALAQGRKTLKKDEQIPLNVAAVDLLLAERKYREAYELAGRNIAANTDFRARGIKAASERGIRVDPLLYQPNETIEVYLGHARAAGALGKWDEAIKSLSTALEYDTRASDLLMMRGDAYEKQGNLQKARADYKRALKFDPESLAAVAALKRIGEE